MLDRNIYANALCKWSTQCKRLLACLRNTAIQQGGKGGFPITHVSRRFFGSYHASRENRKNIFNYITSILLSFDLRKSEVKERQKRARSWCHNYLFLMSLLLVSNDILNQHGSFKGKSRVTLLYPITPHAANFGPITHHADNLGPITRYGKTPLPPWSKWKISQEGKNFSSKVSLNQTAKRHNRHW